MSDLGRVLLPLAVGGLMAVHCSRATLKEFCSGQALAGIFGNYDREASPVGFWVVTLTNGAAALLGIILLIAGIVGLLAY